MPNNKSAPRNLASLYLMPSEDDALRTSFAAIAEPCERQPDVFYQARHGVRTPHRVIFSYFRQAFDAARTRGNRHEVVERIVMFFLEGIAHVRLWVDAPQCKRDVFESAQDADGHEDMAETVYLMDPTPTNRTRLIEAGRLERQRSELREAYLLAKSGPNGRPAA